MASLKNNSEFNQIVKKDLHFKIASFHKSLMTALENINGSIKLNKDSFIEENSCLTMLSSVETVVSKISYQLTINIRITH